MKFILVILIMVTWGVIILGQELQLRQTADIAYYNLELKNMKDENKYTLKGSPVHYKKNYFYMEMIKTYFADIYSYYEYYDDLKGLISAYKKKVLKELNLPEGLDANVFIKKKGREIKVDYEISYKFKVYFDLEKMVEGENLNE